MKYVLKTLAKSIVIPLRLTVTASVTDASLQKKFVINHDYIDNLKWRNYDIMKMNMFLENVGLLIKVVSETTENEVKG